MEENKTKFLPTQYFLMLPAIISQYPPFCSNRVRPWCKTSTVVGCPKVNFSASCDMSQVAATAGRHGGHPFVVWSNFFERQATGLGCFPKSGLVNSVQSFPFHECIIWKISVNWTILVQELKAAFLQHIECYLTLCCPFERFRVQAFQGIVWWFSICSKFGI